MHFQTATRPSGAREKQVDEDGRGEGAGGRGSSAHSAGLIFSLISDSSWLWLLVPMCVPAVGVGVGGCDIGGRGKGGRVRVMPHRSAVERRSLIRLLPDLIPRIASSCHSRSIAGLALSTVSTCLRGTPERVWSAGMEDGGAHHRARLRSAPQQQARPSVKAATLHLLSPFSMPCRSASLSNLPGAVPAHWGIGGG